jgi:hypothetical protein
MSDPLTFVDLVRSTCAQAGVLTHLVMAPEVYMPRNGVSVAGYFDDSTMTLAVGVSREDWAEILAHEFAHVLQYQEGMFRVEEDSPYDLLEDWYAGVEVPAEQIDDAVKFAMACEHDAERRTLGMLCMYRLTRNMEEYIRDANGYVLSYLYAKKHRKWPKSPDWTNDLPGDALTPLHEVRLTAKLERLIRAAQ